MIIRKATPKDVPEMMKLYLQFMEDHDKIVFPINPRLKPITLRKKNHVEIMGGFINKHRLSKKGLVLVAEDSSQKEGKRIVGYCIAFIRKSSPIYVVDKKGFISDLFILRSYRGKKISSTFFSKVKTWMRSNKVKYLGIGVYHDNQLAHKIYHKWGFWDHHVEMMLKLS
ncbi:MAG: GNAT family N-acetyltransferase [Candidatus Woesearchaeota archaeon]